MRHLLAHIAVYLIVLFLLGAATLFAWVRSEQWILATEPEVLEQFAPQAVAVFAWEDLGEDSYRRNCANCHGLEGTGWDQYPGLDHAAMLFMVPDGRDYLIDVHLYGLTSRRWRAPMPPMGHLHDIELAAVINHVLIHFGNEQLLGDEVDLYDPRDIAQRRGLNLSPRDINTRRAEIVGVERR